MNYEKLYFAFIEKYKNQEFEKGVYTEKHHIIPRHAGGGDSKDNLIILDYRQHTFAHRLLWKAYKKPSDYMAWLMMKGQEVCDKIARGKANVESGLLNRIRPLANNEAQRKHARELAKSRVESGYMDEIRLMANDAWRGSNHSEEWKAEKSLQMKIWASSEENYVQLIRMQKLGSVLKKETSRKLSESVILNAERNEEFLQETSSRSKNKFVSPEGLEFDSPILAAKYYGNVEYFVIENWCKRSQNGWSRKPKAAQA